MLLSPGARNAPILLWSRWRAGRGGRRRNGKAVMLSDNCWRSNISLADLLPEQGHMDPIQYPSKSHILCVLKPFFRNELSRECSFKEKSSPSKHDSFFRSLENSGLNGFPLLFAGLFDESWESEVPRTFCSGTCTAFRKKKKNKSYGTKPVWVGSPALPLKWVTSGK